MGLRLKEGLDLDSLRSEFGDLVDLFLKHVERDPLFVVDGDRLRLKSLDVSLTALEKVVSWDGVRSTIR